MVVTKTLASLYREKSGVQKESTRSLEKKHAHVSPKGKRPVLPADPTNAGDKSTSEYVAVIKATAGCNGNLAVDRGELQSQLPYY